MAESSERMTARLMALGTVGTEMVAPIMLGWLLDHWLGTIPLCIVIGAVLGLVGGVYHLTVLNKVRPS